MNKLVVTFAQDEFTERDIIATKKLGSGKYDVFHAKGPSACEEYAVKIYPRSETSKNSYYHEKEILANLDHPHIVKHFPTVAHDADVDVLILEYAPYGDFFDIVTKGGLAHEVHMRTYFHQLVSGLEYIHSQGMAHLDLKLDNLLLGRDFMLKITDFDQAQRQDEAREICAGTNSYRAPEVRNRSCSNMYAADIFSLGVILYAFKTKQFPFVEPENDRYSRIADYDLFIENSEEFWRVKSEKMFKTPDFFTDDFRVLLKGMFEEDPAKRWTIQDIKASEWYNKPILSQEGLKFHMGRVCQRIFQK